MKLGIIGCGLIGLKRARAAVKLGITIAGVYDKDEGKALSLSKEMNSTVFENVDALLANADAVVVATTHDALAPLAIRCLKANKQLLVEKPAGLSLQEVQAIELAARHHGISVKVGYNHRFHPAMLKAHELLLSGVLGPLMYVRGNYGHGGRIGYEKEWRCDPAMAGGGELIDQGSHLIDLSRWFLGDLKLASAYLPTYFWKMPVEDNAFLALMSPGGSMAWLHTSWTEWKNSFSFEIYGRDGKLTINGLGGSYGKEQLTYYKMLPQMGPPEIEHWEFPAEDLSWEMEMKHWFEALENQQPPLGNISDAMAAMRIIDAAYKTSQARSAAVSASPWCEPIS